LSREATTASVPLGLQIRLLVFDLEQPALERRRLLRLEEGAERPVLLRLEHQDLALALDDMRSATDCTARRQPPGLVHSSGLTLYHRRSRMRRACGRRPVESIFCGS